MGKASSMISNALLLAIPSAALFGGIFLVAMMGAIVAQKSSGACSGSSQTAYVESGGASHFGVPAAYAVTDQGLPRRDTGGGAASVSNGTGNGSSSNSSSSAQNASANCGGGGQVIGDTDLLLTNYTPGFGNSAIEGGLSCALQCNMAFDSSSPTGYKVSWKGKTYTGELAMSPTGSIVGNLHDKSYNPTAKLVVIPCYNNDQPAIVLDTFGPPAKKNAFDVLATPAKWAAVAKCWAQRGIKPLNGNNGISAAVQVKGKITSGP